MDTKKFAEKTRRVESAFNILLQNEYLDPRYNPSRFDCARVILPWTGGSYGS